MCPFTSFALQISIATILVIGSGVLCANHVVSNERVINQVKEQSESTKIFPQVDIGSREPTDQFC